MEAQYEAWVRVLAQGTLGAHPTVRFCDNPNKNTIGATPLQSTRQLLAPLQQKSKQRSSQSSCRKWHPYTKPTAIVNQKNSQGSPKCNIAKLAGAFRPTSSIMFASQCHGDDPPSVTGCREQSAASDAFVCLYHCIDPAAFTVFLHSAVAPAGEHRKS